MFQAMNGIDGKLMLTHFEWTDGKIVQQEIIEILCNGSVCCQEQPILMFTTEADNDKHLI